MATFEHTPRGRGFDSSLIYFEHKNDFWSFGTMQTACLDQSNETYTHLRDLWDGDGPAARIALGANGSVHEEYLFRERLLQVVGAHPSEEPLLLVYAAHVAHCPLQVNEIIKKTSL